ncbi:MAG: hypothetical protein J0L67_21490 [Cytophagales bacterium]|nr:hypothetical protein [Cytophagales bacterium]
MKKNIIIGVLALVSVLSMAFGVQQKIRADKNEALAIENEKRAIQLMEEARLAADDAQLQRAIAEVNLVEAVRQRELANGKSSN